MAVLCTLILAAASHPAAAQGCAMCYQTAGASGALARAALRHGILILLVPAASIFLAVLALTYHRRRAYPLTGPRSKREPVAAESIGLPSRKVS